jgi:hypothetical protein
MINAATEKTCIIREFQPATRAKRLVWKSKLDHAFKALTDADALHGDVAVGDGSTLQTGDVVRLLASRLQQVDQAELPTTEKSRLTAALADALLRAIGVEVLDKRLEALQTVLLGRKDQDKR